MWQRTFGRNSRSRNYIFIVLLVLIAVITFAGYLLYERLGKRSIDQSEIVKNQLNFNEGFSESEMLLVTDAINNLPTDLEKDITVSIKSDFEGMKSNSIIGVYLPVTNIKSGKQSVTSAEFSAAPVYIWFEIDEIVRASIAKTLAIEVSTMIELKNLADLKVNDIAIIPIDELKHDVKLLSLNNSFYLDNFTSGALFRSVSFSGDSQVDFDSIIIMPTQSKDTILKINQTGVTALTRVMMNKLNQVGDPLYFSKNIGAFLADADISHVSNEVSFKEGCSVSYTVFCSDPRFIETLKASGVDLVEITGNHNNDVGSEYNTATINLYRSLGWQVFGGGLNKDDASSNYVADMKNSKVAFLGYNYPDSPNGGAIAGETTAGANSFDFKRITADIEKVKQIANFVIVDVQYWECYAYPNGYIEFPECDKPIGEQESVFKKIVDLGADMVVGTQAHQPQTYEIYNGKPIYYGLGNLYFDQTQWPGTERGIILSHYFMEGKLLQTKLSPTRYGKSLQTELMSPADAESLLTRLTGAN